ncbi:MAG: phosphodiester glycosidase family protein, partial [Oscillospiraceae bacterium]|nr:phosphodiester glycosidase family protein [Oscillospiraceae bacterium]
MDRSKSTRVLALVLCLAMIIGILPVIGFAAENFSMTIASTKTSALAPGVQEQEVVAYDANGDRVVYYVVTADVASNPDVQVKANYHDNDNTGVWGKATVIEQANAATEKRGYNVVAIANAAYYNVSTGQPTGGFVMEGVNINGNGMGDQYPFFAVLKDGTAMIGQKGTFSQYSANIQEAVGGWNMLVWDGQIVNNGNSKYPRSTVGVKANGDVVMMVADGNQKPYSAGLTYREQAEVMLSMGCVAAVELDGGGSATYAAKLEGTDELVVRNSCCDGTVRSVSNTLMVISTAVADGTFDHANLSTDYVFYAPYSEVEIGAAGADKSGYPAEIPAGAAWVLSDSSYGTIADGKFVSSGKLGTVTASMTVDGVTVGSIDINVVHPTDIAFGAEEKMIPYGKPSDFTVTALYNGADMYAAADAYDFVCTAGTMNGFVYTAPAEGAGAAATVTASYKYDASVASDSIAVTFGKGSDILFDFEGGEEDAKYWGDYFDLVEATEKGEYDNGYTVIYETAGATSGNLVEQGIYENVFLADRENGKVYSGDYSLAYTVDYRYSEAHANWQYAYLYYWGDPITLLDTEKGINGTRLGMWMYIPEEAVGSCARFAYTYKDNTTGKLNTAYLYLTYQYVEKGFSKLTSDKIPEAGWAYVYVDMKQISNSYVSTSYYKTEDGAYTRPSESNYAPAFIQFIVSSSATGAEKVTFYIDDITLDYSDAVDDRDMPIISDPLILEDQSSFAIDGRTLDYDTITVTASAMEDTSRGTNFTGLNEATAQVYVDGHKVPTKFAAGKISATGIKLPNGTHDITFEIADKQGNYTKLTRQIVIAAESDVPAVSLKGVPVGVKADGKLYTGGQYNITLDTDKVEGIDSVSFKLWLNSASEWALEEMMVLDGFKVEYVLDENSCTADITVTRVDSEATGEATLLTIPVYAWSWNEVLGLHSASEQWNSYGCAPQITVSYKVRYGNVEYTQEYDVDVTGFSNVRVDAKTELDSSIANLKKTIGEWHYHTEVAVADEANTCTTGGHTGRTMCSVCQSILTWGTTKATGHKFETVDGIYGCACGEKFNGELDGVTYIDGVAYVNGWYDDTYYFVDGKKVTEPWVIDGKVYVFGEDGVYQPDAMFTGFIDTPKGLMYFLTNDDFVEGFVYISNVAYYFDENGIARNGEYDIGGETCVFKDGQYVECTSADVYIAGWAGMDAWFVHYKDGRFVFSGTGKMFYHQSNASVPWAKERANIKTVFIGKDIIEIPRFAFAHAYYVEEVIFEEGSRLETIRYSAFHYLNKIKSIKLPETVKTLEWRAFGYWTSLQSIWLPDNVESIHKDAFDHHKDTLVLQVAEGTYAHDYAKQYGFDVELRQKQAVKLGGGDFGQGLSWELLDTGVLTISGEGTMGDFNYNKYDENAAPWSLFRSKITKVVVGSGVKNIGAYAFFQCTELAEVEFAADSALETIGEGSFGYTGLKTVTLPASLKTIGKCAFYFSELETVDVAEG